MKVGRLHVVSVWLRPGAEIAAFEAFERKAAVIMARHGGRIERAVRISGAGEDAPFEVHLVSFPNAESLAAYRQDPASLALAAERATVIARTEVLGGVQGPVYGPN